MRDDYKKACVTYVPLRLKLKLETGFRRNVFVLKFRAF